MRETRAASLDKKGRVWGVGLLCSCVRLIIFFDNVFQIQNALNLEVICSMGVEKKKIQGMGL